MKKRRDIRNIGMSVTAAKGICSEKTATFRCRSGHPAVSGGPPFRSSAGQASSELLLLLPLFIVLAGGVIYTASLCYQGIKVQQAANYAARVQGQERISGGSSVGVIMQDNGVGMGFGDTAPDITNAASAQSTGELGGQRSPPPMTSVYGRFYASVRGMFGASAQSQLFIPPPKTGLNTDTVQVVRVMNPLKVFGVKTSPIVLQATAYGGEDPHMYGLPRWGRSATNPTDPFYTSVLKNPNQE